jgi:hypothetical protein
MATAVGGCSALALVIGHFRANWRRVICGCSRVFRCPSVATDHANLTPLGLRSGKALGGTVQHAPADLHQPTASSLPHMAPAPDRPANVTTRILFSRGAPLVGVRDLPEDVQHQVDRAITQRRRHGLRHSRKRREPRVRRRPLRRGRRSRARRLAQPAVIRAALRETAHVKDPLQTPSTSGAPIPRIGTSSSASMTSCSSGSIISPHLGHAVRGLSLTTHPRARRRAAEGDGAQRRRRVAGVAGARNGRVAAPAGGRATRAQAERGWRGGRRR